MILLGYAALWLSGISHAVHVRWGSSAAARLGTGAAIASFGLLMVGLIQRGIVAGHWPITNAYEVALLCLATTLGILLLVEASWRDFGEPVFVLLVALLIGTYAISRPPSVQVIRPLLPVLRSVWLQVHVITSVVGYGAFAVAAGAGLQFLMPDRLAGSGARGGASGESLERAMERLVALGFPWLTLGILTGAIWAQQAWGRYWGWDPKEIWALVTWLWYVLVLHARSLPTWRGKRWAALVVGGFVLVIFTFIGVPWLVRTVRLESLHGF